VINCPGSWGDGKCAQVGKLYSLIDHLLDGYTAVADTAFCGSLINGKITRILKHGEIIPDELTNEQHRLLETLLIRVRQPVEWGNNTLVQAFKRLRQQLGGDDEVNGHLMNVTVLLHNWQVSTCERNQLKSFFRHLALAEEVETDEENVLLIEPGF
jgi:hypothetical protein